MDAEKVGHTPGPFALHPINAWIVCDQLDDDGAPCPVAALAWPTKYRSEEETMANGRLFAAAPILLKTAQALLAVAEKNGLGDDLLATLFPDDRNRSGGSRNMTAKEARKAMNELRAAITAATEGTHHG